METISYIILACFIVSLISFSGAILFVVNEKRIHKYLLLFVALAAGSMLATATLHLIPESFALAEKIEKDHSNHLHEEHNHHEHSEELLRNPGLFILLGILIFYIIEKFLHWHHHHDVHCNEHSVNNLILFGDAFHNLMDGFLIAVAFMTDIRLGIFTTIAIALHEIPQEIGDLAVLLHNKFSKTKALIWNFTSGLTSIIGGIITYFFLSGIENLFPLLSAFTAGAFIYIALADIVPELKKNSHHNQIILSLFLILGVVLIGSFEIFLH